MKIVFITLAILNALIWFINLLISNSTDRSGAGMVMMFTVPVACAITCGSALFAIGYYLGRMGA